MSVHRLCVTDDQLADRRIVVDVNSEETHTVADHAATAPPLPHCHQSPGPSAASPVARALHLGPGS
ncbi:hypothetical protein M877_11395 [Streptomyces niveus NCIMB 11891]|nr:hypothetical protein M877_11395 [Streptomyces niveus NCIMB 11891]